MCSLRRTQEEPHSDVKALATLDALQADGMCRTSPRLVLAISSPVPRTDETRRVFLQRRLCVSGRFLLVRPVCCSTCRSVVVA